jgi:hypothetical protein
MDSKESPKQPAKAVKYYELFQFSTVPEKLLNCVALLFAFIAGVTLPMTT